MMKLFNKMYFLVLALAVVFTLNNCAHDEISPQEEEGITIDDMFAKKKVSSASGQAGLVYEEGEGGFNGYVSFSFHVTKDIDGNISGSFQGNAIDSMNDGNNINMHGTIECVTFVGNRATMAGTITKINSGETWNFIDLDTPQYDKVYFEVQDNGEGKNADPDQFSDVFFGQNQLFCDDFNVGLKEISNGNIQVTNNEMTDRHHRDNANPVVHRVTAGGNDICEALGLEPGCDGNFSLIAIEKADGTVMGQWQDTAAGGGNGFHVDIDCLAISEDGISAYVSGYVKNGSLNGDDYTDYYMVIKLWDNGTSNNDDPDQMSFSFFTDPAIDCSEYFDPYYDQYFVPYDLLKGQVKIK